MQKRTKDILILVIGLIALSVAVYVSLRGPAAPPGAVVEKKPAPQTVAKAPAPSPSTPPVAVEPPAPEGTGPGAPARNPFSSPLPEAGGPAGPASPVVTPSNGAAPGTAEPPAGGLTAPAPGAAPAPTFTLSGFSRYNGRTMATLRAGERHFYVYEGDSVGDGYRVSSISSAKGQVVLAKTGQQPIVLTREGGK